MGLGSVAVSVVLVLAALSHPEVRCSAYSSAGDDGCGSGGGRGDVGSGGSGGGGGRGGVGCGGVWVID